MTKYVRFLVGSFRATEAEDPEVISRALKALLGSYPEFVVRAVCDPRSGLPATSKFFPTLYEVRTACEAKLRPILDAERRRRAAAANEADRPAEIDPLAAERRKTFIAAWRAKQALREATNAGVETPLADMDARKLQGEHREMVKKAIDAKLAQIAEKSRVTPLTLSPAALRAIAPEMKMEVAG